MKNKLLSITAVLLTVCGGVTTLAQTGSEKPAEPEHMGGPPGHHMSGPADGAFHHRFDDANKWAKEFDKPERDAWQKPEEILDALHLKPTSSVADIGAGTGYFSVRIAKRIPDGKIFAADVEPDMVRYLGERARREHLTNLVPVQASADAANLPEPVDVVLIVDTYHHIGSRPQYFAKLKSSLRSTGAACDSRLQGGFAKRSAQAVSHSARKGDGRTRHGRLFSHGDASILAEAILPRLSKA